MEEHRERLEEIKAEAQEIVDRYNRFYRILGEKLADRYEKLQERYERHIAGLREDLENEQDEIREAIENLDVDLPEIPEGEADIEREDWLFDSERAFLEQTVRFRRAQGKECARLPTGAQAVRENPRGCVIRTWLSPGPLP
jgi:hypothetical protein